MALMKMPTYVGGGGGEVKSSFGSLDMTTAGKAFSVETGLSNISKFVLYNHSVSRMAGASWDSSKPTKYSAYQIQGTSGYSSNDINLGANPNAAPPVIVSVDVSSGIVNVNAPSNLGYGTGGTYYWLACED